MYSYDNASRLSTVGDSTNTATYSYLANSPLVEQITFKQHTTTRMTTTKAYDSLNRLTSISHLPTAGEPISYAYGYNAANQRTNVTHADNSFWEYAYDHLGQVKRGTKNQEPGTPYPGLQFEYDYDDIGNRTETRSGGDTNGGNLRVASYSPNLLNQYASRDVPPYLEVHGEAATNAIVTVNNQPTDRLGGLFRKELNPDNSSGPLLQGITNVAVLPGAGAGGTDIVTTESGSRTLASTPETFTYDADGNLITDGLWTNIWNGENRLIQMESRSSVPAAAKKKLLFTYDSQGRRIRKEVQMWDLSSNSYLPTSTNSFVYDGWNLVEELDGGGNVLRSYAWGTDLSGSMQGAGGVGGLTGMRVHSGPNTGDYTYVYDGNGNVMALVDSATGAVGARYEYSPFGRMIRASGPLAAENKFRFSTKYQDDESGWIYYGYRFYNSEIGRWINRDPIGERGGVNPFGFIHNRPIGFVDVLGLATIVGPRKILALDKTFPDNPSTWYTVTGTSTTYWWWASGNVRRIGSPRNRVAHFAPSGVSGSKRDTTIGVCTSSGVFTKKITIIRPAQVSRPARKSTIPGGGSGVAMGVTFWWTITDQFGDPLPAGVTVNLSAAVEILRSGFTGTPSHGMSTDTTNNAGEVRDRYVGGIFRSMSGFRTFSQYFTIGNWRTAPIRTTWWSDLDSDGIFDGSYSGMSLRRFY